MMWLYRIENWYEYHRARLRLQMKKRGRLA